MIECTGCKRHLDESDFRIARSGNYSGRRRRTQCRRCEGRLKRARRHGGEPIPLDAELPPDAVCACCGATERLVLDHCHKTGKVRGVLCRACNLALGYVDDDPARLRALIDYLGGT